MRPPFFECASSFSRRRPTKQRVRSKGVVENENENENDDEESVGIGVEKRKPR